MPQTGTALQRNNQVPAQGRTFADHPYNLSNFESPCRMTKYLASL